MQGLRRFLLAAAAALIAVTATAADSNIAGTWNLTVETQRGTRESILVLTQAGENVSGTYKGQRSDIPIAGTVKGNAVALSFKLDLRGSELEVKYTGTVEGNTMSGTVAMGQMDEGKFTAKKQ